MNDTENDGYSLLLGIALANDLVALEIELRSWFLFWDPLEACVAAVWIVNTH